jgi:hypothetical protein
VKVVTKLFIYVKNLKVEVFCPWRLKVLILVSWRLKDCDLCFKRCLFTYIKEKWYEKTFHFIFKLICKV